MISCELIVEGKYILPIDKKFSLLEDSALAIIKNNIAAIGPGKEIKKNYQARNIINAGNSIIMPGLVNTHTHAAMSYFRGMADDLPLKEWLEGYIWPAEAKYVNPDFVRKSSELACLEMIESGTTCFNDMYFFGDITADVAKQAGMRACLGEVIINFPTPSAKTPKEAIRKTNDLIKEFKSDEYINIVFNPHSIYALEKKFLLEIKELAKKYTLPVHIHVSETKAEVANSLKENKCSPVSFLNKLNFFSNNVIAAHSVWLDDEDLKIYSETGVKAVHCPSSNMKLGSGIASFPEMIEKDIVVGLGTDGAASNNTQNIFSEMRTCALLHKANKLDPTVVKAREVVKSATINGARVLGLENKIGSLETGKRADLITINLDKAHLTPIYDPYSHLVYCARASDVNDVIVNGKVVMRNKEVRTLDKEIILKEARV